MPPSTARKATAIALHALVLWVLCGAVMGMVFLPLGTRLVVHAVAAPVFAAVISAAYTARFGYTGPLATAAAFLAFIAVVDFFLVALIVNRSLDMFRSVLGTWLPFALIFAAAWGAAEIVQRRARRRSPDASAPRRRAG